MLLLGGGKAAVSTWAASGCCHWLDVWLQCAFIVPVTPASRYPSVHPMERGGLLGASFGGGARAPLCSQGKLGVQLLSGAASAQAKPRVTEEDLQGPGCILGVFPDASCSRSASLLFLVVVQILITVQSAVALSPALGRWQRHPG